MVTVEKVFDKFLGFTERSMPFDMDEVSIL
jgi:hypothetical protein